MKIVAGLGSIDEYETFVKAGADEFFCGYVPFSWAEKYGVIHPLNRREVLFYNVQIGSMSELQILKKMVDYYGKPVKLTFNSLYYTGEQYPVIAEIITQCMAAGFENFIIADPALMLYLRQQKINCGIHLSGETAEVNRGMLEQMLPFGIRRVIFHRKNSLEDMQSCIKEADFPHEYEAFILNELCHFSGAFCNSLHCDELTHLCRVPYELGNLHKKEETDAAQKDVAETDRIQGKEGKGLPLDEDGYLTGSTGCGLCALYRMKQVGITHLKLVGRGNYTDFMEKDIRQLRKVLDILENSDSEAQYQKKMKASLFPDGCSRNCYYR
uniref:U32 family peptidase n=1 Tax=Roseburia inulinivorans TaxID=360807 RepID=UPI004026725A